MENKKEPYKLEIFYKDVHGRNISISSSGMMVNGEKNGLWTNYYLYGGGVYSEVNFKDDKENGLAKTFYNTGELDSIGLYEDGLKTGTWNNFSSKGKKTMETNFKRGMMHGSFKDFHRNGKIANEYQIENGRVLGIEKRYTDRGELIKEDLHIV